MPTAPPSIATLSMNGRKARYGISYVANICAQSGIGFVETSPDEDVLAVDGDVKFAEGSVGVQVKCSSRWKVVGSRNYSVRVKAKWVRNWEKSLHPIYLILVVVPGDSVDWLDHPIDQTVHRTVAYWVRINPQNIGASIVVPRSQRLRGSTLDLWRSELLAGYKSSGAP